MASDRSSRDLTEDQRFPRISDSGRPFVRRLREDPHAPRWNWPVGEQLDEIGLNQVRRFAADLQQTPPILRDQKPTWLASYVDFCLEEVPFYRHRTPPGTPFLSIPSCNRDDLAPQVWAFVPDSQPLDSLICFPSSGVTGHPAKMPTHPATVACGIPLLEHALAPRGVSLPRGPGQMALVSLAAFPQAYTTGSILSYLDEAGYTRLNLLADDWRNPGDARRFLDRWPSPLILGDPVALSALCDTGLAKSPEVIASCTVTLTPAFAEHLRRTFGCPVMDVIAMTEVGILAVGTPFGHAILPHDVYVEILDEHDEVCPTGTRGEVTLTGGRNPFAPLLRYRTGDFASLEWINGRPTLIGYEGRPPVWFPMDDGRVIHSMAVARCLGQFPISQYRVHQHEDGSIDCGIRGPADPREVHAAMMELFGPTAKITMGTVQPMRAGTVKVLAFWSARKRG